MQSSAFSIPSLSQDPRPFDLIGLIRHSQNPLSFAINVLKHPCIRADLKTKRRDRCSRLGIERSLARTIFHHGENRKWVWPYGCCTSFHGRSFGLVPRFATRLLHRLVCGSPCSHCSHWQGYHSTVRCTRRTISSSKRL